MTRPTPILEPRGLNREQAAGYVGVRWVTFDRLVLDGAMPLPRLVGNQRVWDKAAIDDAFDRLPRTERTVDFIEQENRRFIEAQKTMGTCVYFIDAMNRIKIGYAKDLEDRILRLQTGCPLPLLVVGLVQGGSEVESAIHHELSVHRERGEWFKADPEVIAYIRERSIT